MSFSADVKEDLLQVNINEEVEKTALIASMLRFGGEIILGRNLRLSFTCNSMNIVRYLIKLLKEKFEFTYEIASRTISRLDNHTVFTCMILDGADRIIKSFNIMGEQKDFETDAGKVAYLRGAFLVRGSVNDPNSKSSHLEISYSSDTEILYVQKLMNSFELNARIAKRKNNFIAYIKSKDVIGEFLYLVGASKSMEYYQDIVITKEIKATAKRTINLDVANQGKTNKAAQQQLAAMQYLEYNYPLEKLDNKLLMVMKVRMDNPEASLNEMLDVIHEEFDPNLTKSGLNHRLKRLIELAESEKNPEKN